MTLAKVSTKKIYFSNVELSKVAKRLFLFSTILNFWLCYAFKLTIPGVTPIEYVPNQNVPIQVNKVTSTKTQIPYQYYKLPFCKPEKIKQQQETLGEVLEGEAVASSPYEVKMKVTEGCKILCRTEYSDYKTKLIRKLIRNEYRGHLLVESLPAAVYEDNYAFVTWGFPIGFTSDDGTQRRHFLNNHLRLIFYYNEEQNVEGGKSHHAHIVGFQVVPMSLHHTYEGEFNGDNTRLTTCDALRPANPGATTPQSIDEAGEVIFTYDVQWQRSNVRWANRWDIYLKSNPNESIHLFSIFNSFMMVLFLTGLVAMIMLRTLHRDISKYNQMEDIEVQEEVGWKSVHGDVFRAPTFSPTCLAVFCGTGIQILVMSVLALVFSYLGITSPQKRGSLLTALLLLFVSAGSTAGYFSARMFKFFQLNDWKKCTLLTALLFPSVVFLIFLALNILLWCLRSSSAVPLRWGLALLLLWLCVSLPLVCLGSYFGFSKPSYEVPVKVTKPNSTVPPTKWHTHPAFQIMIGGLLPFGTVCIELFFIMSALWLHQVYLVFGFLAAALAINMLTCAEITIITMYFQLCSEDYRWWWRSFLTSGSSAIYLYIYSLWYFVTKLEMTNAASIVIYFSYMLIIALTFFLMSGTVGFYAAFWFVTKIYGAIKID